MLLPRIRRVLLLQRVCTQRSISDAVPKYSSKVRALPFAISKEDATANMSTYAKLAFAPKDMATTWRALASELLGSSFATPVKVEAVYVPAWIIDSEMESNAWMGDSSQEVATAQIVDSYLPGFAFDFLSSISLNSNDVSPSEALPFTTDLTNQHGSDVVCLPYNIAPFSVINKLESLPKRIKVSNSLQFESAVKTKFLAAYPILIPLYLGKYEFEGATTTVVLEASEPWGRVYFQILAEFWPDFRNSFVAKMVHHIHGDYYQTQGARTSFARVFMPSRKHGSELQNWLDNAISKPGGPEALASEEPVNFDDERVRVYTEDEVSQNRAFLEASRKVTEVSYMMKSFAFDSTDSSDNKAVVTEIGTKGISKMDGGDYADHLKSEIEEMNNKRTALEPEWWRSWAKMSSK